MKRLSTDLRARGVEGRLGAAAWLPQLFVVSVELTQKTDRLLMIGANTGMPLYESEAFGYALVVVRRTDRRVLHACELTPEERAALAATLWGPSAEASATA